MNWHNVAPRERWLTFERSVIALYNEDLLTLGRLDSLGELFRGLIVPWKSAMSAFAQNGMIVEEITLLLVNSDTPGYKPPPRGHDLWMSFSVLVSDRWGWE